MGTHRNSTLLFRLQVFPLHSTVTLEEQNVVFLQPVSGYRKVNFFLFFGLFSYATCSHRLFNWWPPPSRRSSCPPTLQKVQWLFQMWNMVSLSVDLAQVFRSTQTLIICFVLFLFFIYFLSQWLTSVWLAAWFVTKKPIYSFWVSPGHRKPTAISVEVQRLPRGTREFKRCSFCFRCRGCKLSSQNCCNFQWGSRFHIAFGFHLFGKTHVSCHVGQNSNKILQMYRLRQWRFFLPVVTAKNVLTFKMCFL